MIDINAAYRTIVSQLSGQSIEPVGTHASDFGQMVGLIATGNGESFLINHTTEKAIRNVADWMRQQRPPVRRTHTVKEWQAMVRATFGPALAQLDFSDSIENVAHKLRCLVETEVTKRAAGYTERGRSMGCWLFSQPTNSSISIGPVCLEPKAVWLTRALASGDISKITHCRLSKSFSGKSLRKRKSSSDSAQEKSILEAIGSAPTVCTTTTQGLAPETTQWRAILAARLTLTSISLLWSMPSQVLDHFRISTDHGARIVRTVPVAPGPRMIGGSRLVGRPAGFPIDPAEWDLLATENAGFLSLSGRMIACWTSRDLHDQASPLLLSLSQSIFFFWKACREESDVMAIVEFAAAVECLCGGTKEKGIVKLLSARLGINAEDPFYEDKNLRQTIKQIYKTGRSQTIHGTNSEIVHDWSPIRTLAECVARLGIVACMEWFQQNPSATNTKDLLK